MVAILNIAHSVPFYCYLTLLRVLPMHSEFDKYRRSVGKRRLEEDSSSVGSEGEQDNGNGQCKFTHQELILSTVVSSD